MKKHHKKYHISIFLMALIITLAIFLIGFMISFLFDTLRQNEVEKQTRLQELKEESFVIQQDFITAFDTMNCQNLQDELTLDKIELNDLGVQLTLYGQKSLTKKKGFDYLKRKYFLLELEMLVIINQYNRACGMYYYPLLFFYIQDNEASIKQGFILEDLAKADRKIIVLSFDADYTAEPIVQMLKSVYEIKEFPTLVNSNTGKKLTGFSYAYQVKNLIFYNNNS